MLFILIASKIQLFLERKNFFPFFLFLLVFFSVITYFCLMKLYYSLIIPVFNRPDEVQELLQSIQKQTFSEPFEVVIIEDGSDISSQGVVHSFENSLNINYIFKKNSGPGDSRNYGMRLAKGNYFIILDSDCILPPNYLKNIHTFLTKNFVDCFGGSDTDTENFSDIQKAINYAMTSFFTTGGIRGNAKSITKFEPRSFNMGISKKAFEASQGFGKIHPGEDPELTIRLWKLGFQTTFIPSAFVFHKRRISWQKFYKQVSKFGQTRPILNYWHPEYKKIIHWFPTLFILFFALSLLGIFFNFWWGIRAYLFYFSLLFIESLYLYKSLKISTLSLFSVGIQFTGYGLGFLRSTFILKTKKQRPEKLFPHLFFN